MNQNDKRSPLHDILASVLGLFCLAMLACSPWQIDQDMTIPFYKGPMLMPVLVLSMGVLASLPSLFRLLFRRGDYPTFFTGITFPKKPALMFTVAACHPLLMILAGLEAATFVVLFAELRITGTRSLRTALLAAAVVSILFRLVFKMLLDVWFPEPLLLSIFQQGA